jgi:hypothetical protein
MISFDRPTSKFRLLRCKDPFVKAGSTLAPLVRSARAAEQPT